MKFMDSSNSENQTEGDTPVFKTDNGVDLMKSEKGFENIVGSEPTEVVEPKAETITSPEQLDNAEEVVPTVEDPVKNDLFNKVVDNDPMGLEPKEETPIVEATTPSEENNMPVENLAKTEEPVTTTNTQLPFMEPKKKGVSGILVVLLIIMFFVAAGCVYYFIFLTPDKILTKTFDGFYSEVNTLSKELDKTMKYTSVHSKGSVTLEAKMKDLSMFDGYKLDFDLGYDKTNKKVSADLGLSGGGEELLNVLLFAKENDGYFDVSGITPKMLKADISEFSEYIYLDKETEKIDINYLVTVMGNAFQKAMDKSKITKKISYGDPVEKKLGIVLTYDVDAAEYRKVVTAVFDALSTDTKALEILKTISSYETTDEVKEALTEELQFMDFNIVDTKVTIMTDVFTNELLYFGIKSSEFEMTTKEVNGVLNLNAVALGDNAQSINLEYNKTSKELKMVMSVLEDGVTSTFDINVKINVKSDKNVEVTSTITATPDSTKQGETIKVTVVENSEWDAKIEDIDVSKAVLPEELTEEELVQMTEAISGLLQLFGMGEIGM